MSWKGAIDVECPVLHCGAKVGFPCIGSKGTPFNPEEYTLTRSQHKVPCKYHTERYALFEEKVLKEQEAAKTKAQTLLQAKHPEDSRAWEPWVMGPTFTWMPKSQNDLIEKAYQQKS